MELIICIEPLGQYIYSVDDLRSRQYMDRDPN